ncbi:MAG: hypothetical protein HYY20_13700 [Candidatus Tectomicrobia bacterium]|uniref:Uncharacterized protein n=1 Tax=Tectimicrobiota bacterium TaxID=2528274 RepID=A0A932CQZ1_UNCTE|nr:hypothetical protein [Candidatus Tectomicrobia bacterium]
MSLLIALFGFFIGTLGLLGMIDPERLLRFARRWQSPAGLYLAALLRVVLGLLLFLTAPDSHVPGILHVLGGIIFTSGLATPLVGLARFQRILGWWADRSPAFKRAWAGCALAFGLLLLYAVIP